MSIWQIIEELMKAVMLPDGFAQRAAVYQLVMIYVNDGTVDVKGYVRERQRIARLAWIRERIS